MVKVNSNVCKYTFLDMNLLGSDLGFCFIKEYFMNLVNDTLFLLENIFRNIIGAMKFFSLLSKEIICTSLFIRIKKGHL